MFSVIKNKIPLWLWIVILIMFIVVVGLIFSRRNIEILNGSSPNKLIAATLSGLRCSNAMQRPLAIMLSSDPEARPLSGIGQADMVFEMPVTPSGVTRMMAIFQCEQPKEIGSVRSSRLDFVPLAQGLGAIYAHFGGEHEVLKELNSGVIDNIDGLKYDGTIYYRKKNIKPPHNAFTSSDLIGKAIKMLGYKSDVNFTKYLHEKDNLSSSSREIPDILYANQFRVRWDYDVKTDSYLRFRNNAPETDKNNSTQVSVKNIVVMKTIWSPISKDYLRVETIGSGTAIIYKNGAITKGGWQKKDDRAKLYFYDANGKEIQFSPGKIWVEIVI